MPSKNTTKHRVHKFYVFYIYLYMKKAAETA